MEVGVGGTGVNVAVGGTGVGVSVGPNNSPLQLVRNRTNITKTTDLFRNGELDISFSPFKFSRVHVQLREQTEQIKIQLVYPKIY